MRTVYLYPVFDRFPFRLACSLPLKNICLPGGAFGCTWSGVGYGLFYVAGNPTPAVLSSLCEVGHVGLPGLAVDQSHCLRVWRCHWNYSSVKIFNPNGVKLGTFGTL